MMVSNDLYAFGVNDPATEAALAAWSVIPGFTCAGYPSSMGYGSDGPIIFLNQVFYKSADALAEQMRIGNALFQPAAQASGVVMSITFKTGPASTIQCSVHPSNGVWTNLMEKMTADSELGAAMPKMLEGQAANLVR